MRNLATQRAVDEAVRRTAAHGRPGSKGRLAALLGVTRQAIDQWASVPPHHVLAMEKLSGVSRYELRPDIYGEPPETRRRANG